MMPVRISDDYDFVIAIPLSINLDIRSLVTKGKAENLFTK